MLNFDNACAVDVMVQLNRLKTILETEREEHANRWGDDNWFCVDKDRQIDEVNKTLKSIGAKND